MDNSKWSVFLTTSNGMKNFYILYAEKHRTSISALVYSILHALSDKPNMLDELLQASPPRKRHARKNNVSTESTELLIVDREPLPPHPKQRIKLFEIWKKEVAETHFKRHLRKVEHPETCTYGEVMVSTEEWKKNFGHYKSSIWRMEEIYAALKTRNDKLFGWLEDRKKLVTSYLETKAAHLRLETELTKYTFQRAEQYLLDFDEKIRLRKRPLLRLLFQAECGDVDL